MIQIIAMKRLLPLLFWLFSESILAQYTVNGIVLDAISKDPISDVRVFSISAKEFATSDSSGKFSIIIQKLPANISFKRVGYYDETFQISDSEWMEVYLESSSWLSTIDIGNSKIENVAGTTKRWIWDYALMNRYIVVCDYGNSLEDARLVCLTEFGDTVAKGLCPVRPLELFTDCEGNVQLQGKDSTYQVVISSNGISYLKGEDNLMINKFLRRCVDEDDINFYFAVPDGGEHVYRRGRRKVEQRNDEMYYFRGSKEENKRFGFWVVTDGWTKGMKEAEKSFGKNPINGELISSRTGDVGRFDRIFFNQIFIKEIYAPLFSHQDTVFIFDHPNGRIEKFSKWGSPLGSTFITYSASSNFERQILRDEISGLFYAVFKKNNMHYLCKLNPHTGVISDKILIPHAFVEKMEIRNGYLYFLTRTEDQMKSKVLQRIKLT